MPDATFERSARHHSIMFKGFQPVSAGRKRGDPWGFFFLNTSRGLDRRAPRGSHGLAHGGHAYVLRILK